MLSLISEAARESWGKTSPAHSQRVVSFVLSLPEFMANTYAVLMPCEQTTQSTLTDIHIIFVLQAVQIVIYLYSSIFPYSFFQLKFVSFDPNLEKVNVNESSLIH